MKQFSEQLYLWLCLPIVYLRYRRDSQQFRSKEAMSAQERSTSSDHTGLRVETHDSEFQKVRESFEELDEFN